jgi:hypothetical protein
MSLGSGQPALQFLDAFGLLSDLLSLTADLFLKPGQLRLILPALLVQPGEHLSSLIQIHYFTSFDLR